MDLCQRMQLLVLQWPDVCGGLALNSSGDGSCVWGIGWWGLDFLFNHLYYARSVLMNKYTSVSMYFFRVEIHKNIQLIGISLISFELCSLCTREKMY